MTTARPVLRDILGSTLWPTDLLDPAGEDGSSLLDAISIVTLEVSRSGGELTVTLALSIEDELSLEIPGTGGMRLVLGKEAGQRDFTVTATVGESVSISLTDVAIALRFPDGWFTPADDAAHAEIGTTASFSVTFTSGEEPAVTFSVDPELSFGPFYIGSSEVLIQGSGIEFAFDRANPPTSLTAGVDYPVGGSFLGVVIGAATVSFPTALEDGDEDTAEFEIVNASIGTSGFTGTVSFSGSKTLRLAGSTLVIDSVSVAFAQNMLTAASLGGTLSVPMFHDDEGNEQPIDVDLSFDLDGNFSLVLAGDVDVTLVDVATLSLDQLGITVSDGVGELSLSGGLAIEAQPSSGGITWPHVSFSGLRIRSDGTIYAPDGAISIDEEAAIELYGFKIFVSELGFGTDEGLRTFIRLSGGIAITEDLPMGVSADGLEISWVAGETGPEDIQLSVGGVGIEFAVPEVFSFSGYLALDFDEQRFAGRLDLTLDAIDLSVHADFIAGTDSGSGTRYWFLDVSADLPVGIPLGPTGLGIFGFRGIVAGNMKPSRTADQDWYEDWYKQGTPGIDSTKFEVSTGAVGLGAGLTVGVLPNGFAFAIKGTFLITFPGPVIFLEGRASILRDRSELSHGEPPLSALMVVDVGEGTFQVGMGADLVLYEVISISGDAEAFFDFDDGNAWYVDIGKKPEEDRIHASVLEVLQANAYFMADPSGIETGAAAMIGGSWSFGPAEVTAEVSVEGAAAISVRPQQLYASLAVRADIGVTFLGTGLELSASAIAEAQAAEPYTFDAKFELSISMPSPLKDIEFSAEFSWESNVPPEPSDPVESVVFAHPLVEDTWTIDDAYVVTGEGVSISDLPQPGATGFSPGYLPADSRPVIQFSRPMADSSGIADNAWSITTTGTEQVGKSKVLRELVSVRIYKWSSDESGATAELVASAPVTSDETPLYACWLATVDGGGAFAGYDAADSGQKSASSQLMIWGRNPFERTGGMGSLAQWMTTSLGYPCTDAPAPDTRCWAWDAAVQPAPSPVEDDAVTVTIITGGGAVVSVPPAVPGWTEFALQMADGDVVELTLADAAAWIELRFRILSSPLSVEIDQGSGWVAYGEASLPGDIPFFIDASGVVAVRITALGGGPIDATWFYGVCYTTQISNDEIAAYGEALTKFEESVTERWSSEADIFEPDSVYYIDVRTRVTVTTGTDTSIAEYAHVFEFRTYPAPGSFPDGTPDADGPLDKLDAYVAGTDPGPATAPHYRSYGLVIAFNRDYVGELYDGDLVLQIYDDKGQVLTGEDGEPLTYYADAPPELTYTEAEVQWLQTLSDDDCTKTIVTTTSFRSGGTFVAEQPELGLDAQRTYTVHVLGGGVDVYQYSFVTSRYSTFTEHLADRIDTVFLITVETGPDETELADALSDDAVASDGSGVVDRGFDPAEQNGFDAVCELLGIGARTPPSRVDLSHVSSSTKRYAVLLESPEPLPFARLRMTLRYAAEGASLAPVASWSVLRRADGTAMLIFIDDGTTAAGNLPAGSYSLECALVGDISDADDAAIVWVLPDGASEELATLTFTLA